jgi:phage/plasmid-associated DNA primase
MIKKLELEPLSEEALSQLPDDIRGLVYNKEYNKLFSPKRIITNLSTHDKFKHIRKIRGETEYLIYNEEKKVYDKINYISLKDLFNGYFHHWKIHRYCSNRVLKEFYETLKDAFPPVDKGEINPKNLVPFKDCIYDIEEGSIRYLTSNYLLTNSVGYALNSSSEDFPETRQFLKDVGEDKEDGVEYAEAIIAYTLFQFKGKQYIFHLYGREG